MVRIISRQVILLLIPGGGRGAIGFYSWHSNQYLFRGVSKPLPDDEELMGSLYEAFEDFQWGDAGDLFFVIRKSDLAKKDFRKVYVTLESS
ncbi:DUF1963 domain-containing protein [Chitinophaga sp. OAE865]|uniref:DUF1963 domain-containing protein n=1 Tax=Chitinophaga sp. OAE865 TaxID=2817898 RepID=UPI001AE9AD92